MYLQIGRTSNLGELALFSCNMRVYFSQFSRVVFQFLLIFVNALSIPKNSRISRSVLVLISLLILSMTLFQVYVFKSVRSSISWIKNCDQDLTDEGVSIPSRLQASDAAERVRIVFAKSLPLDLVTLTNSPGDF